MVMWTLTANGKDITALIRDFVEDITLTDDAKDDSDQFSMTLAYTRALSIPARGAFLTFTVDGLPLGNYLVDGRRLSTPAYSLSLEASGTPFNPNGKQSPLQTQRTRKWPATATLVNVLATIAKASGLASAVSPKLKTVSLEGLTQKDESDLHFIQRVSQNNGAYFKINGNTLVLHHYDDVVTANGQTLPTHTIRELDTMGIDWQDGGRSEIGKVTAKWRDAKAKTAKSNTVTVGTEDPTHALKQMFPTEVQAKQAAQAELTRQQNKSNTLTVNLPMPRFDIFALHRLVVTDAPDPISTARWKIIRVIHRYNGSGWTTTLNCEGL
jgi:uncharacterized protein